MNETSEKDNRLQYKISLMILAFAIVFIGVFGAYAFFKAPLGNNQKEGLSVQTGNMELIFSDGNNGFNQGLNFGESVSKTFTLKNNGSLEIVAKINWKNLTNTYLEKSLTYTLTYVENEGDTPIEVIKNKNIPYTETPTTIELSDGLTIPVGKTYTLTLTITLNDLRDVNQTSDLNAMFNTEFSIEEGNNSKPLVSKLLGLANDVSITDYNSGNKGELFTFTHPEATQTTGWSEEERTDYRYIGNTPNNYINFNDETWRIIGVFTVEGENGKKEQRIKIIRDESIGDLAWDTNNINEWSTSTLSTLLNSGDYYNRSGDYATIGLTDTAKSQIALTKWYLGGNNTSSIDGPAFLNFERGMAVYTGRSTNTIANVGLIYPSDYVYTYGNGVDNTCYQDGYNCSTGNKSAGWLFNSANQWTIAPFSSLAAVAFFVGSSGGVIYSAYGVRIASGIRPCVYLRPDIEITGGDGSSVENAYILKS